MCEIALQPDSQHNVRFDTLVLAITHGSREAEH